MRERKFEKSHIHILQTETLSRESRFTESAQEIVDSPLYLRTIDLCLPYVNTFFYCWEDVLQECGVLLGRLVMIVYYGLTTRDQKGLTLWIGGSGNPPNT
jgi:hypothetical protein